MRLTVERLGKRYRGDHWGLRGVDLDLGPGVVGLLGPNGAGKSTLLRIVATITTATEGRALWNGRDVAAEPDAVRTVLGYLPQDFGIYPNLTPREFLAYLAAAKGIPRRVARERIEGLLDLVNLREDANRRLGGFSGGMRQRVGIAQALLADPQLLIVDEPTTGLDPEERVRFRNLLSDLAGQRIVVLSTHIVSDVESVATDLVVIDRGRLDLVAIATPLFWITLPGLAFVAAVAVLFETIRFLARGFGNFVWFFAWPMLLVTAMEASGPDLFGIVTMKVQLAGEVRRLDPALSDSFRISLGGVEDRADKRFRWNGLEVTSALAASRAGVVGLALLVALAAALPFDRFDPSRRRLRLPRRQRSVPAESAEVAPSRAVAAADLVGVGSARRFAFGALVASEVRVAVRSMPRWWWLGVVALAIGGLLAPSAARSGWLAAAFLWPALVWSSLATRDRATGVAPLLATAPRPLTRQLPAVVAAGWAVGLACAAGPTVGLALAGDRGRALAATVGCLAMPALAVALGILSGGPRLFEGIFITIWYIGPLQRGWQLDFAGVSSAAVEHAVPVWFLLIAAALLAAAIALEHLRRREGEARFV